MRSSLLKKTALIAGLGIFGTGVIFAQEKPDNQITVQKENESSEKVEKKKFPGKLGIEASQTFQIGNTEDKIQKTARSEDAFYSKTEFKGKIDFKLTDFYNIVPWLKNRVDVYSAVDETDKNFANTRVRDRFDIGFDNVFTAKDIMKISVTPAVRIDNDFKNLVAKIIFLPNLTLSGAYNFGLKWEVNNTLYLYWNPAKDTDEAYEKFGYEGKYSLRFDVLKTAKVKDYGFEFFAADNVEMYVYSDSTQKDITVNSKDDVQIGDVSKNEFTAGATFKLNQIGLSLTANYYQKAKGNIYKNTDNAGADVWNGFQLQGEFSKENWTFGVQYTGDIQGYAAASSASESSKITDSKWENTIEAYIKFKL